MLTLTWLLIGLISGACYLYWARSLPAALELRVLTAGLLVAALIYVGFATIRGNPDWILIELVGVAIYGVCAFLTYRISPFWLAAGWGFHPAWDVLLHLSGAGQTIAPYWYVIACISFDLLVAVYIVQRRDLWTATLAPNH